MQILHRVPTVVVACLFAVGSCLAQITAEPATGTVLGTGAVTGFVEDMDRSLAFYHEVFGMEVPPLPESGGRPYNASNSQLFAMFDIAGAKERHQFARLGDVRFELMEIQNVEHTTIPLRIQDPGTVTLVFTANGVDGLAERAVRAGGSVVTQGGVPIRLAEAHRAIVIRDVDGRFIELREPSAVPTADAPALNGMRISIAVADMARTLAVYRNVLGFTVESDQDLGADPTLRALTNLPTAEFHRAVVHGPNASLAIELVEYGGIDRTAHELRIQDRGAARLQLRADDVEALVAKMKRAGLKVVSQGGGPVPIPPNFMGALVADPNGFFLTPFAPCDGCAPRLVPEGAR